MRFDQNDDQYLIGLDAKAFINSKLAAFTRCEDLGATGVLEQSDIAFSAWKLLRPRDLDSFCFRLSNRYEQLDLQFLCELGKRRARANAVALRFSASAQLHIVSQPSGDFDRFLAHVSRHEQMRAHEVCSSIVEQRTFPRPAWMGLADDGRE